MASLAAQRCIPACLRYLHACDHITTGPFDLLQPRTGNFLVDHIHPHRFLGRIFTGELELADNVLRVELSLFSFSLQPWVLPDTHRTTGPAVWLCGATLMWVSHSFTLFWFCPCSFLHSKERKWRQHDKSAAHSHHHHAMWSKAAKEKSLFQSFLRLLCSLVTVLTSS